MEVARIRTPNALQSDGVPDHKAIMASSYRVEDGGVQFCGSLSSDQSSVEHGSSSPRASAVVTTGGVANIRDMHPENMNIQKYVLIIRFISEDRLPS